MRVQVNGTSLYVDIEGAALEPDGYTMREKPTLLLLHDVPADGRARLTKPGPEIGGTAFAVRKASRRAFRSRTAGPRRRQARPAASRSCGRGR
jgi:hypothetical protein